MKKIALFASGTGSNAVKIVEYLRQHYPEPVDFVLLSNKADAPVLAKMQALGVETYCFNRADFYQTTVVAQYLGVFSPDLIVLAGFLWLVPTSLTEQYPQQIVNLHPSLLPKFGGKGMYGAKVHEAVLQAGETESGITIHYVNEHYDQGQIILQAKCPVNQQDTIETLSKKVQVLEHTHLPETIARLLAHPDRVQQ